MDITVRAHMQPRAKEMEMEMDIKSKPKANVRRPADAKARFKLTALAAIQASSVALIAVAVAPCGLVSSDIASVSFELPARHYVFDAASWKLPSGTVPTIPCTSADSCCALASAAGYDCATNLPLTCDQGPPPVDAAVGAGACAVTIALDTPPQTIDLRNQVPQLAGRSSQSLAKVSIRKIEYDVKSTLNRELPEVELFLAPADVSSPSDPKAQKFGTVPVTPANADLKDGLVRLEKDSEAIFAGYASDFGTPFRFMGRANVVIRGGETTPQGIVDITVRGLIQARPSF